MNGGNLVEKHIFDTLSRIPASQALELGVETWNPPTINKAGHLVQAQPRENARRDASSPDSASADEALIAEARAKAQAEGLAQGKAEGLAAGKTEGLALGKQEANQQMQQELKPKLAEINKLMTTLTHSLNEEDYKLEQTMMQLIQTIAKAVVRKELATDPGQIMAVIKETISSLPPNRDNIKIILHPSDKKIVDQAIAEGGENWRAVSDDSITAGGCKIETDQSVADFTLEQRIQTVLDQLDEQQAISPKVGDSDYEEAPEAIVKASTADVVSATKTADDKPATDNAEQENQA